MWMRSTQGSPTVSVPVLSKMTVSTCESVSRTSPPRMSRPRRAATLEPTSTAVGVARPSAQGHATTSTLAASWSAIAVGDAPRPAAARSRKPAPTVRQRPKVSAEAAITPCTKRPLTMSAILCTSGVRWLASSVILITSASCVSLPAERTPTTTAPSMFTVPANTSSPMLLFTGIASPLIELSFTLVLPLTTTPSTGSTSPGVTMIVSPCVSFEQGITV